MQIQNLHLKTRFVHISCPSCQNNSSILFSSLLRIILYKAAQMAEEMFRQIEHQLLVQCYSHPIISWFLCDHICHAWVWSWDIVDSKSLAKISFNDRSEISEWIQEILFLAVYQYYETQISMYSWELRSGPLYGMLIDRLLFVVCAARREKGFKSRTWQWAKRSYCRNGSHGGVSKLSHPTIHLDKKM